MAQFIFMLRRGPASEWTSDNPTLRSAEPGVETDTGKMKLGDGITSWNDLDYYPPSELSVAGVASVDGRDGIVVLDDLYAELVHGHVQGDVSGLTAALAAKAATVHTHAESDVTSLVSDLAAKAATVHTHAQADTTGLVSDLAGKAATVHTHAESDVTGLVSDLASKAASVHTHAQSSITNLENDLDAKADLVHTHAQSDVTGLVSALSGKSDTGHVHAGTDITTGKIASARLNVGTSSTDVAAGDHDHGGGGGSTLVVARKRITSGHFAGSNTSGVYVVCNNGTEDLTLTLAAAVDDYIQVVLSALVATGNMRLEYIVVNGGSIVQYGSTNTGSPAFEGDPGLYNDTSFKTFSGGAEFVVTAPMINAGNVTVGVGRIGSSGSGQIYADTDYPCRLLVHNHGPATIL